MDDDLQTAELICHEIQRLAALLAETADPDTARILSRMERDAEAIRRRIPATLAAA